MDQDLVVLDTDFINGITDYQDSDPADLFRRVFQALGCVPVVHAFVADHELMHNAAAQALLREGTIRSISLEAMEDLDEEDGRRQYRNNFEDMYRQITGGVLPKKADIFARNAGRSFGEIHSILLATELGIPLLYSNDSGARTAARYYARGRLTVQNAEEVAELLTGSELIDAKERKFIRNIYRRARREHRGT